MANNGGKMVETVVASPNIATQQPPPDPLS
jgi:hypothetical protein